MKNRPTHGAVPHHHPAFHLAPGRRLWPDQQSGHQLGAL